MNSFSMPSNSPAALSGSGSGGARKSSSRRPLRRRHQLDEYNFTVQSKEKMFMITMLTAILVSVTVLVVILAIELFVIDQDDVPKSLCSVLFCFCFVWSGDRFIINSF
jgi:hypothetical protein